ncbi:MAG: alpha/beta hydrolase [Bacteroidales bacterium]|jgi:pimeloyl-ACP methyl ester carboxylesterase
MKKILNIGLVVSGSIILLLIILFVLVLIESPGKPRPFLTKDRKKVPGSISVIETLNINGLNQKMIIRGIDTTKPILLYLHGGPGDPEFPFVRQFNPGIEDLFVVCYWDQRGAGLSYSKDIPPETMTLSQFVDDAGKVSEYLIHKFKRKKIYLLGHSWGTMLGSFTVNKYPDYYYAFISVGQVGDQERSEKISYDFVLARARELKDIKAIRTLEKIGPPPYSDPKEAIDKMMTERKYVIRYGGAVKKGDFYPEAVKPIIFCREYNLIDKINYLKGMKFTRNYLWDAIMKTNLFKAIPLQQIPVYVLQGTSDYQTSYIIAKEYFDSLQAPVKKFCSFENSAHSPIFEEPAKFDTILKAILSEQKMNGQ